MENKDNRPSFICSKCNHQTFYNPSDYIDYKKGKELLLEMEIYEAKKVFIACDNQMCKSQNVIQITHI